MPYHKKPRYKREQQTQQQSRPGGWGLMRPMDKMGPGKLGLLALGMAWISMGVSYFGWLVLGAGQYGPVLKYTYYVPLLCAGWFAIYGAIAMFLSFYQRMGKKK